MIRPRFFLILVGLIIGIIGYFSSYVPLGDPFASTTDEISIDLTTVPTSTVAAFKIRHAISMPSMDIGLFGNSRILAVSARDVGYPVCRFFNFALSGESIRASIALIEHFTSIGKMPRIAIVGIDNFESQYFGNPTWPSAIERWRFAWIDLARGWKRQDVSRMDWLRMGWRHLHIEGELVHYLFERRFFLAGVDLWLHGLEPTNREIDTKGQRRRHYRVDGSLSYEVAGRDVSADVPLPSAPEQIIAGYLRHDLRRLASQQAVGRRVIVYESPVAPASAHQFARHSSPYATFHRTVFLEECQQLGLICRPDPGVFAHSTGWRDSTHPPAEPLGAHIRTLISESASGNGAEICINDL